MYLSREDVIVRVKGGLGNQLFQYAAAKSLALRLGVELLLDINWYFEKNNSNIKFILDRLQIEDSILTPVSKMPRKITTSLYKIHDKLSLFGITAPLLNDIDFQFNHDVLNTKSPAILDGYWQNENYFLKYREDLINFFQIKGEVDSENKQLLKKINLSNSICLHVRRGDYINDSKVANVHGTCSREYYCNALDHLSKEIESPTVYVFSDEPEWAKTNLNLDYESIYVDINSTDKPELDLLLMKSCKYFIIANSTFSWWAAWLSLYKNKKVIAPKTWFKNMILNNHMKLPSSWLRI